MLKSNVAQTKCEYNEKLLGDIKMIAVAINFDDIKLINSGEKQL